MTIPAAMHIEMAADMLPKETSSDLLDMLKEFHTFGLASQAQIGATLAKLGASPMAAGYILGFETARAMLSMMPPAAEAKVTL